jgi:large subunit ribosomal protein L29
VNAKDLRELTPAELANKEREIRNEYFGARVRFATGQLENTAKLRTLRREIARLETLLRAKSDAKPSGASR